MVAALGPPPARLQSSRFAAHRSRTARLLVAALGPRASRLLSSNPHDILGIGSGATADEIKAAYHEMALLHHPDRVASADEEERAAAEQAFKSVSEAFQTLTNPAMGRPREGMSKVEAEALFWQIFGTEGTVELAWRVPGRSRPPAPAKDWQQYQALLEASDDAIRFTSGLEARSLYRSCLRSLRGLDQAAEVREHARQLFAASARETDVGRIRALLVDGRHSLDEMVKCLGTAALRYHVHDGVAAAPAPQAPAVVPAGSAHMPHEAART